MSSSASPPALPRASLFALWTLAWGVVRWAQLFCLGWGTGNDVGLYLRYAERWSHGRVPYVDFHPEYPPGSLPLFLAPFLVTGRDGYQVAFALEMAAFDLVAFWLVLLWGRRLFRASAQVEVLAAVGYLGCTALLFPVLYARFDLVPSALLCGALYAAYTPRFAFLGAVLLGVAGGVKLWPFALTPLFLGLAQRKGGLRQLRSSALGIALGALATALPVLPRAGVAVFDFLAFHAARGIQIESTWSTLVLALHALGVADASPVHEFGAFHVAGALARFCAALSVPALLVLALLPQLLALRGQLGRAADTTGAIGVSATAAAALGFMVGGKVLSPQYMLWVVPFLPLLARNEAGRVGRAALMLALLLASALTTLVYPYWSPALEQREEGHTAALLAVGLRNLTLVALYIFALRRAAMRREPT